MENAPSTFSTFLVAIFLLFVVPAWLFCLVWLMRSEIKAKTKTLAQLRWLRLPAVGMLMSALPAFKEIAVSGIAFITIVALVYGGLYFIESPAWTREEKASFIKNQLKQIAITLVLFALAVLLIRYRFPNEPWS